ncbi:hypothetical protein HHK36_001587 [Tetracentron sinense]|uniref:Uncharacterized protein n=1 Tax=Tetracentron sinense TaxID=13715 RepID=A0A834ZXI7_TETSI|nr:hypothetical protein HHK36_001587 [Tetracentron sinense]
MGRCLMETNTEIDAITVALRCTVTRWGGESQYDVGVSSKGDSDVVGSSKGGGHGATTAAPSYLSGPDNCPDGWFLAGKSVEEIKKDAARERNRELAALSRAARQSGSQLQNKTSSFVQNTSILPGVTTQAHILQQQGNRVFQNGRPQHMLNSSLTKGIPNCLDEFKHGFPTNGLSTDSIRWWGSSSPDGSEEIFEDEAETDHEDKQQSQELADDEANSLIVEDKKPERGNESDIGPQGTGLLSAVRKRAAEDGQEALKLGVCSSYREYKLGRKERVLLHRLFNSSLPSEWSCGSS